MNKNSKLFDSRYQQIVGILFILMIILAVRLFMVTVIQHEEWTAEASDQNTKSVYTPAPRGNIYDKYGRALAISRQAFAVTVNVSSMTTEEINTSALTLINTLIKNGDKYTDNFPVKLNSKGKFYYTYDVKKRDWLVKEGFPTDSTATEAFDLLREKYNVDSSLGRTEAMTVLQDKHKLDPPIYVKTMNYSYDVERKSFLSKFGFKEDQINANVSAKQCFQQLRKDYSIDKTLSNKEARKIFVIRNEIATNNYIRYKPITVASDIKEKTIAYITEAGIPGVEITSTSKRYYPNGSLACHILGYMGAISESETKEYVEEQGYSVSDLVGKEGIEYSYESKLHGTPGETKIRVNSTGEYVETIGEPTEAKKGSDVYLTLDLDLQKTTEASLKGAIAKSATSKSGAAVAIDVKTGEILSMASYPTMDPNIFANGITEKAWESVQAENPRDPLSPAPLYNNATRTAVAPGSTFKPITAVTALECGLNPNQYITDGGFIKLDREYACSAWNDYGGTHGAETLEWGIGNSCNYYFFCISTGKDWNTGASLGYKNEITVDKLLSMTEQFGLGKKTGIELGETVLPMASAEGKMDSYRKGAWNAIYDNASKYFPDNILKDDTKLTENITTIANWIYKNPSYDKLINLIDAKTDTKKSQVEALAAMVKFDYFNQAQWSTGDQFNLSIGQGDHAYTPLQMANYVATLGNNGIRNQVSVIAGVEGEGKKKKERVDLNLKDGTLDAVIKGMKRVCSSGTLSGVFGNFPVEVAGKTGTAENQSVKQPKDEVAYVKSHLGDFNSMAGTKVTWRNVQKVMEQLMDSDPEIYASTDDTVDEALIKASKYKITQTMINQYKGSYDYFAWTIAMAPADDPEIAVVVMLVEGGYSSNAAPVAKDIISDYLDINSAKKIKTTKTNNTGYNRVQ